MDIKIKTKFTKREEIENNAKRHGAERAFTLVEQWLKQTYKWTYRWKIASFDRFMERNNK